MRWISQLGCAFLARQRIPVHSTHTDTHGTPSTVAWPGPSACVHTGLKYSRGKMDKLLNDWNNKAPKWWVYKQRAVTICWTISTQWALQFMHMEYVIIIKCTGFSIMSPQQKALVKRPCTIWVCFFFYYFKDKFKCSIRALTYILVFFSERQDHYATLNHSSLFIFFYLMSNKTTI